MSDKLIYTVAASVGSLAGGYLPLLWGGGAFSGWAIIFSTVGGFLGIIGAYKYLHA